MPENVGQENIYENGNEQGTRNKIKAHKPLSYSRHVLEILSVCVVEFTFALLPVIYYSSSFSSIFFSSIFFSTLSTSPCADASVSFEIAMPAE